MENFQATHPLQLIHLDYPTIEVTEAEKDFMWLVIMDHFMQHVKSLAKSSQTAKCTVQALWDKFVVHYGLPENIV